MTSKRSLFASVISICAVAVGLPATAQAAPLSGTVAEASVPSSPTPSPRMPFVDGHGQITLTQQSHGDFPAAHSGAQSLQNSPDLARTFDATLFLGFRLWRDGELYVNPELDQGFGLGNASNGDYNGTVGAAGFVSGEAYKVGSGPSYARLQRLFLRQVLNRGADRSAVDSDINQLATAVSKRRITLTLGKFAVTDVFDNNPYAHDPKNDFLNWAVIDMGAFDYAADAWGYTDGLAAEFTREQSTLRLGLFQLSVLPNDIAIEHIPLRQYSPIVEYERRTSLFGGHPGALRALVYGDDAYVGAYGNAVAQAAANSTTPDTSLVRTGKHFKSGAGINVSQEVARDLGVFLRYSVMNGSYEADEFSDIDRSLAVGASINGDLFRRPNDTIGFAVVQNGLSSSAARYFGAGGLGLLVGDGSLSYAAEDVFESYYKLGLGAHAAITADIQHLTNPGYNAARGPVSVFGLRYHAQY